MWRISTEDEGGPLLLTSNYPRAREREVEPGGLLLVSNSITEIQVCTYSNYMFTLHSYMVKECQTPLVPSVKYFDTY